MLESDDDRDDVLDDVLLDDLGDELGLGLGHDGFSHLHLLYEVVRVGLLGVQRGKLYLLQGGNKEVIPIYAIKLSLSSSS